MSFISNSPLYKDVVEFKNNVKAADKDVNTFAKNLLNKLSSAKPKDSRVDDALAKAAKVEKKGSKALGSFCLSPKLLLVLRPEIFVLRSLAVGCLLLGRGGMALLKVITDHTIDREELKKHDEMFKKQFEALDERGTALGIPAKIEAQKAKIEAATAEFNAFRDTAKKSSEAGNKTGDAFKNMIALRSNLKNLEGELNKLYAQLHGASIKNEQDKLLERIDSGRNKIKDASKAVNTATRKYNNLIEEGKATGRDYRSLKGLQADLDLLKINFRESRAGDVKKLKSEINEVEKKRVEALKKYGELYKRDKGLNGRDDTNQALVEKKQLDENLAKLKRIYKELEDEGLIDTESILPQPHNPSKLESEGEMKGLESEVEVNPFGDYYDEEANSGSELDAMLDQVEELKRMLAALRDKDVPSLEIAERIDETSTTNEEMAVDFEIGEYHELKRAEEQLGLKSAIEEMERDNWMEFVDKKKAERRKFVGSLPLKDEIDVVRGEIVGALKELKRSGEAGETTGDRAEEYLAGLNRKLEGFVGELETKKEEQRLLFEKIKSKEIEVKMDTKKLDAAREKSGALLADGKETADVEAEISNLEENLNRHQQELLDAVNAQVEALEKMDKSDFDYDSKVLRAALLKKWELEDKLNGA